MSDMDMKENWKLWYPEEVFLKKLNVIDNKKILKKKDFYVAKNDAQVSKHSQDGINLVKKIDNTLKIICIDKNSYDLGFQDGTQYEQKKELIMHNKLRSLCISLENTVSMFRKMLLSRLLKTTLIVASYIVGDHIKFNKLVLLEKIKKIIDDNNILFEKSQLIVHPDNQKILENILKKTLIHHKIELVYNTTVDVNGFKIKSENGNIDHTIDARYKELCRLIYSEEFE